MRDSVSPRDATFWFQQVALRHMEPEHAAEIMCHEDRERRWLVRLARKLGFRGKYRPIEIQCGTCLRWRRWQASEARRWPEEGWEGVERYKFRCPACRADRNKKILAVTDTANDVCDAALAWKAANDHYGTASQIPEAIVRLGAAVDAHAAALEAAKEAT